MRYPAFVLAALFAFSGLCCLEDYKPRYTLSYEHVQEWQMAQVSGTVLDSKGVGVCGALISIKLNHKVVYDTASNLEGHFQIEGIKPSDLYTLIIEYPCAQPATISMAIPLKSGVRLILKIEEPKKNCEPAMIV